MDDFDFDGFRLCEICGKRLTFYQISYCSAAHKMKAYRQRKKQETLRLQQPFIFEMEKTKMERMWKEKRKT